MRLVVWLPAAALAAGIITFFAVPPRYESHALISLRAPLAFGILQSAEGSLLSRHALATTIVGLSLYTEERPFLPLEDIEDQMRRDIVLETPPSSDRGQAFLRIRYFYRDPVKAQAAVSRLVEVFAGQSKLSYREASEKWEWEARAGGDQPYFDEIARLKSRIALIESRAGLPPPELRAETPAAPLPKTPFSVEILSAPSLASHRVLPWSRS